MIYLVHKHTKEHRRYGDAGEWADTECRIVEADDDGWIEHDDEACPLPAGCLCDVKHRDGEVHIRAHALCAGRAEYWIHLGSSGDIIAYRPILDTKPKEPAWDGEGLPPVGARCEMLIAGWEEVFIAGMDSRGRAIAEVISSGILIPTKDADQFRPIRSAEKRAKDAIAGEVLSAMDNGLGSCFKDVQIAAVVYAAIRGGKIPGVKLEGGES